MKVLTCSLDEALAAVADDMSIGLGGVLGRRRPLALCAGLVAAGRTGLHAYSFLAGAEIETLVAGGAVSSITSGYFDPAGRTGAADRAIEDGRVEWREVSEQLFVGGLRAAAAGLPFWPTLGAVGSDVAERLDLREIRCPYSGRPVLAVPATPLDVTLLHAEAATQLGAVLAPVEREFLDDADVILARAAKQVIVTVDRIASADEAAGGRRTMLAPFEVAAVVWVPADGRR